MDHRAEVDPLGGHEGEPLAEIESELVAEEAEGTGAGAVRPAHAFAAHPGQQVEIRFHDASRVRWPAHHSMAAPATSMGTDRSWPVVTQPKAR